MRKIYTVLIISLFLFCALLGCSTYTEKVTQESTAEPNSTSIHYSTFYASFVEYLNLLTDFELYPLPEVALPEEGETIYALVIKDTLLDRAYHVSIYCTEEGAINTIDLFGARQSHTDLQFAVLSLYVYQALGLPDVDPNTFYTDFDMFSNDEKLLDRVVDGWEIVATTIPDFLSFTFIRQ